MRKFNPILFATLVGISAWGQEFGIKHDHTVGATSLSVATAVPYQVQYSTNLVDWYDWDGPLYYPGVGEQKSEILILDKLSPMAAFRFTGNAPSNTVTSLSTIANRDGTANVSYSLAPGTYQIYNEAGEKILPQLVGPSRGRMRLPARLFAQPVRLERVLTKEIAKKA